MKGKGGVMQMIDSLEAGGAEVLAVNIANALHEKGINSHLCVTRKEGVLKKNILKNVGYIFLYRRKKIDLNLILRTKRYIKEHNIIIIHAHSSSYFFAFCVKVLYPKVALIWHDHYGIAQDLETRKLLPLKYISFFFKAVISVNTSLKVWAHEKLFVKRIYFLNNFPSFNKVDATTSLKGVEGKRIVHLAAFRPQKDHLTLITAFEHFLKVNIAYKDWTLHLVGNINNSSYSKKVINTIKQKELENVIFTYGSCLDIYHILNKSSIGVLSSVSEGLPISLLEYGLAKLPVIITNVGECNKVVVHEESGYIIEPRDFKNLSLKLEALISSITKRISFGNFLYKNVLENYSKENFVNQLLKIYKL